MDWSAVFLIAAVAAVFGFGRDIVRAIIDKRKKFVQAEQEQIMQPLKIHGIVLADTEKSFAIQSTLLVQARVDLTAEQKRRIEAESERDALQKRLEDADRRERQLLIQLGRAYGGAPPGPVTEQGL